MTWELKLQFLDFINRSNVNYGNSDCHLNLLTNPRNHVKIVLEANFYSPPKIEISESNVNDGRR